MKAHAFTASWTRSVLTASVLALASGLSLAQSVSLSADATKMAKLPDGQQVPMWGYTCGAATVATCAPLNAAAAAAGQWSPVLITLPIAAAATTGSLTVSLANNLPAPVPTSLVIVGQLGGGLGSVRTTTPSPTHPVQGTTWPIAGDATGPTFQPPAQSDRVQSFATEVASGATNTTLQWSNLKRGTYLIESGTHPSIQGPMGLYGVLVVTTPVAGATAGQAYTGVSYDAEQPVLLSEIDPVQNRAVAAAVSTVGFSETATYSLKVSGTGSLLPAVANCSGGAAACYPPVVNYDPRYYQINGRSFDRTKATDSLLPIAAVPNSDATLRNVLLRFVNAGLRMHVPSVVGLKMALIAEDGNKLPGVPKVQNEVFLAAGKTYDASVSPALDPAAAAAAYKSAVYPIFDRQLSLSTNNQRDGGMQAYVQINGGTAPALPSGSTTAKANADTYFLVKGTALTVADPTKGVIKNDVGVYGVTLTPASAVGGTVSLNADGTFTFTPTNATVTTGSFAYCGNGATTGALCTTVTLQACGAGCLGGAPTANGDSYTSNIASRLQIGAPGVLANDTDPSGLPLKAVVSGAATGGTVTLNADGSFTAVPACAPNCTAAASTVSFNYTAVNSQGTSSSPASVSVAFNKGSGLQVRVYDGPSFNNPTAANVQAPITDYRWIIEEDRTILIDPASQTNTGASVRNVGTNFHTSYMPVVASGCVGKYACEFGQSVLSQPAICDQGNGVCRPDASGQKAQVDPSQVFLDPTKRYYLSILPGDGANAFLNGSGAPVGSRQFSIALDCPTAADFAPGSGKCGHGLGGAPIKPGQAGVTPLNVVLQQTPFPTAKIAVFVFEDDMPLNGEHDAGGGVDILAPNEPGLGGFEINLFDDAGGPGDATGQITYDMFNMPISNALAGTIDPVSGKDACPISKSSTDGIVGRIITCPKYEADGTTLSPLAGQAIIANLYPGRYGVVANPAADRIGRGEEWLQTNTLDGQKAHDSFIKVGGPGYFQEFGPAGFHVAIGFANPAIINARRGAFGDGKGLECSNQACNNTIKGQITGMRLSRTPDQRLYSSGSRDALAFTQCYVSLGDPDGADIAFTKCDGDGNFEFSPANGNGIPDGQWRLTILDQWNDQIVDGLSTPAAVKAGQTLDMGQVPVTQWHTNIYTRSFIDTNKDGVSQDGEPGLALVATNIRFRDGSYSNFNNTDLNGFAGFNEIFPLFNWYLVEADTTRFKQTGVHVVYDTGGPADGTPGGKTSNIAQFFSSSNETIPLPTDLRFPGSRYCLTADCAVGDAGFNPGSGTSYNPATNGSSGRVDPPWVTTEAWQGFIGQAQFVEFGKTPYAPNENGGIKGEVVYASTRPFDDPALLLHLSWTPNVPNVTVNLYKKGTAADGSATLTLVDTTKTSSWDDWAQGFRTDGKPNMNCPGQVDNSPFYFTLQDNTQWLNPATALPYRSRFKCYDGLSMFNQVQPAPYDGMYQFPSVVTRDPVTGRPTATNCAANVCVDNPTGDGTKMLPPGKYVVEVILPSGYELVKEEDKNILIGDNYIAPVTQQFPGLGNVFILPDQAAVNATYNPNNPQNPTTNLGSTTFPRHEGDTGSIEAFWPCVGAMRVVPDFISLFPGSAEVAPFAGATRPLCDRKEITLTNEASALAKFYIFSATHVAAHFTGIILDDLSSEFDPFSPQFGEKFAVPNVPISFKDFAGNEISRFYSDQWGQFNGLNFSSWEVNPPNPTGYAPQMMVTCMNDPGTGATPDAGYNPGYSTFCYEIPFMPGQTQYMDTPVVPTMAFAQGYNPADCAYPDTTPAIKRVDSSDATIGPWVSASGTGHTVTITALGTQQVLNNAYSGPSAKTAPFNQKYIARNYGFGATQGTGSVTIGGQVATVTSWSDASITVSVPSNVPACTVQPFTATGTVRCGQLVVTAGNGKKSIDAVTVTVGGSTPTYVTAENAASNALQTAIDTAAPGALIIVGPPKGATAPVTFNELVQMWKPVRLQGVGAPMVVINANTHPSGKLDAWRQRMNCLFGLTLQGRPSSATPPGCDPNLFQVGGKIDRIPFEGILGWDTSVNGNLAGALQEPTLLGAYEGAGITVLAKGVRSPAGASLNDIYGVAVAGGFPAGTLYLGRSNADCASAFASNFRCNPARIDGFTVTNSSQGGGGIFAHGWNHFLEVSNNRVYANAGTLSGGISIGQGEFADAIIAPLDPTVVVPPLPADAPTNFAAGVQLPYWLQHDVNVHHNSVTQNSSYGDELYSATPAGAGGVTFCTGADNYKFNNNWVCGNLSSGDGGGVAHLGFIYNGNISNNQILFNQSTNPTIPTHGGGLLVAGVGPDGNINGVECGTTIDIDCAPALTEGAGPGLVIDANLISGNSAESGSGGGIRLHLLNGTEVSAFPTTPSQWYQVSLTNNIITNNVAGFDGGGVSLQDALKVNLVNNTIAANDSTASSGVLFNTLGSPISTTPPPGCDPNPGTNPSGAGCPTIGSVAPSAKQPAGVVTMQHTSNLQATMAAQPVTCPPGHTATTGATCTTLSYPLLENNLLWQNRSFNISVGGLGTGLQSQQNLVTLLPQLNQAATGQCVTGAQYWDVGVRGDTGPANHAGGGTLNPQYSILTSLNGYAATNVVPAAGPGVTFQSQACNGARVPPENGGLGYNVPPGIADATLPNPVFSLTAAATVDEGNNWINMSYGPLTLVGPTGTTLSDYHLVAGSTAIDKVLAAGPTYGDAPNHDFFGNPRKGGNAPVDIGAVEFVSAPAAAASVTGGPLAFGNVVNGTTSAARTLTLSNTGNASLTGIALAFSSPRYSRPAGAAGGTCGVTLAAAASCTINVVFSPNAVGLVNATLAITANVAVTGSPVGLSGTGVAPTISATLTPTSWSPSATRGVGAGFLCLPIGPSTGPCQIFTLTNTGNVTLTGITQGALGGTSPLDYNVIRMASTCGPAGGGQLLGQTTLAPGAMCIVTVQFRPRNAATIPVGVRNATVSVTDLAGTQTSVLAGTAN